MTTRVLTRGARPRTRLVPATTPSLVVATAGSTLGTPRGIPIPSFVGSRGLLPTITVARPTGAPSTGMLYPPKVGLLSLLVDVQKAPELVVHAGTGLWGKPPVRGDTTPWHKPGTGRDQSRNTPLAG